MPDFFIDLSFHCIPPAKPETLDSSRILLWSCGKSVVSVILASFSRCDWALDSQRVQETFCPLAVDYIDFTSYHRKPSKHTAVSLELRIIAPLAKIRHRLGICYSTHFMQELGVAVLHIFATLDFAVETYLLQKADLPACKICKLASFHLPSACVRV